MGRPIWLLTAEAMDAHGSHGHPERPERRLAAADGVRDAAGDDLQEIAVEPASDAAIGRAHRSGHLDALVALEGRGGGWLDPDTYHVTGSLPAARLAAGATVRAAEGATSGEAEVAFAVVRPPGHHAGRGRASGFCLVNNIAVAVEALRHAGRARRVAIVDWDVHHGDGTQEIFDADPDVFYASTHQSPLYPGTGDRQDRGTGAAIGTKHNVPLPPGAGDDAFTMAWRDELLPALAAFGPEAIIVSAGYDAHAADPLAHLAVTEDGYAEVARALGSTAARLGIAGIALTLEGGYDLDALRRSVAATVRGLREGRSAEAVSAGARAILDRDEGGL
jgi:acetoin utilization deacetylase AcuC-like enzyme